MKKLKLTKKIPQYSAYLWDGTVESYYALVKEIGSQAEITYHLSPENSWLDVQEPLSIYSNSHVLQIFAGQYIVFTSEGVKVMNEDTIKSKFDVVVEEKVYTGRLQGKELDAWNQSTILGDVHD